MSEQHSKGVPWNAEKLEIIDPGRPYVLSNGKAVLKDPSRTVFHEHQFSFRSSNYAHGEKEAKEHAVLMARFHRLLAEKGYFHPSTIFGVYSADENGEKVYRIFSIMPKLKPIKQTRRNMDLLPKIAKRSIRALSAVLEKYVLSRRLYDYNVQLSPVFHRLLAEKGYFPTYTMIPDRPSNFGRDEKGRVWATDLGLWIYESEVPSAEKLREILKKTSTQAKKSKTSPPRT